VWYDHIALGNAITIVQESRERMGLNGTHQPEVHADDVDLLGENTDTIKTLKLY
jgi:hypothetical protein